MPWTTLRSSAWPQQGASSLCATGRLLLRSRARKVLTVRLIWSALPTSSLFGREGEWERVPWRRGPSQVPVTLLSLSAQARMQTSRRTGAGTLFSISLLAGKPG